MRRGVIAGMPIETAHRRGVLTYLRRDVAERVRRCMIARLQQGERATESGTVAEIVERYLPNYERDVGLLISPLRGRKAS